MRDTCSSNGISQPPEFLASIQENVIQPLVFGFQEDDLLLQVLDYELGLVKLAGLGSKNAYLIRLILN